ncbi:MAG: hypothetical protein Sylvanvirus28_11 [Sylvanvirus sp.]|uniref:Uncharacterized protein n=1 Tax=Sylvanvirus sp. TaxID=2487774 RepID=A0A3G5AIY0_9VIRU|nr:MAG: hypothetical protein Sylvanvirus28_11 [Sylvanvirus sp.]
MSTTSVVTPLIVWGDSLLEMIEKELAKKVKSTFQVHSYPGLSILTCLSDPSLYMPELKNSSDTQNDVDWFISLGTNDQVSQLEWIDLVCSICALIVTNPFIRVFYLIPRMYSNRIDLLDLLDYHLEERFKEQVKACLFFDGSEDDLPLLEDDLLHLNNKGRTQLCHFIEKVVTQPIQEIQCVPSIQPTCEPPLNEQP